VTACRTSTRRVGGLGFSFECSDVSSAIEPKILAGIPYDPRG
jgi:hypothetical protein